MAVKTFKLNAEQIEAASKRSNRRSRKDYDSAFARMLRDGQTGVDMEKPCKNGRTLLTCAFKIRMKRCNYKSNFSICVIPHTNNQLYAATLHKQG